MALSRAHELPWWRSAAIYQIYPRSFADADGDGVGDLAGVLARLPYLAELGIDAIWFNPWYASPQADAGYDVADYRRIDPLFGTLEEAEELIRRAHESGIRVVIDVVPNHTSDQHPWFQAALAAASGSPERERFWFRPGRGEAGELPPTDWQGFFGGPAWSRVTEPDGSPGEWYLHLFAPEQPDFQWEHPEVRAEFEAVLRFWFDRGADGFRIDSAALLVKDPALPVDDPEERARTDREEVHEVYRAWRRLADSYSGGRVLIGEVWLPDPARLARYLRPGELHTVFNFPYLECPWEAEPLRTVIDDTLRLHTAAGAPATWVLSNHDVDRVVTRYGRADTSFAIYARHHGRPVDLALGTRRARAAALLTQALPGSVYLYQGEELGLWEVETIPDALRQDPMWERGGRNPANPGRDGCRVPLPWSGDAPPFGFSPDQATAVPWLPQPDAWKEHTVAAQAADPGSMLSLYRAALRLRRELPAEAGLEWVEDVPTGVLAFRRGEAFACVVNLSAEPVVVGVEGAPLLASGPVGVDRSLPPDTAVWLRIET
ncbi:alpha-glucosidase [Kitasatospora sp. MMS16-BH015]|uniref:glycoside hydrolase family 13 protein n=1 Tax=Kitasatospora sp. MMS16-BH015 TaxID=2018025 RepID=UPI000CA3009F|nr:glycoside hydrolase family 13 protein [Kitasatospora sp. MMS16-BH015]AUG75525.1 alpha-glucosidase [Kitasatospora sp. MMS16-BH015]